MIRKLFNISLVIAMIFGVVAVVGSQPVAHAQDGDALEYDTWVEGELTNDDFEDTYTLTGTAGDVIIIEMYEKPGEYGLSPEVKLLDPVGGELAANSYFIWSGAIIVRELAFDGEYTVMATRVSGAEGSSEGIYILRAQVVALVQPGDVLEATVHSDSDVEMPDVFVFQFEEDTSLALNYEREPGDLFPSIQMQNWAADTYDIDNVFELDGMNGTTHGTIYVDLAGGTFYILSVEESFASYSYEIEAAVTTITVEAAE